jgi:TonB-dependent starch-binding outer membrane protein SusC
LIEIRFNVNAGLDYAENEGFNRRSFTSANGLIQEIPIEEVYGGINRNTLLDFYFNYKPYVDALSTSVDLNSRSLFPGVL